MTPEEIIYDAVRGDGIPDPLASFIVAQARHETGVFTSRVYKYCNNAFGYKAVGDAPKCRQSPEGDFYRSYASLKESAQEVAAWIRRRQREGRFPDDLREITTSAQYANLLKKSGYYGASESSYALALSRHAYDPGKKKARE